MEKKKIVKKEMNVLVDEIANFSIPVIKEYLDSIDKMGCRSFSEHKILKNRNEK